MNITNKKSLKHGTLFKILVVVLAVGMVTGLTAYLTTNKSLNNQFTVGYVKSEIVEDYEPPKELKPGVEFKKTVSVKNTGRNDCYVRVLVTFSSSEIEELCDIDYNTNSWKLNDADGYWYYNKLLKSGETTEPLFTKVKVKDSAKDEDMQDFDISIYHETSNTKFNN